MPKNFPTSFDVLYYEEELLDKEKKSIYIYKKENNCSNSSRIVLV